MFVKSLLASCTILVALVLFQYFNTGSASGVNSKENFEIIAHRGVHQHYVKGKGKDLRKAKDKQEMMSGCETDKNIEPTHEYIENTIESIQAAFDYGATIVEIDVRLTSDNRLVVFHDGKVDCKTNGTGRVRDLTAEELETLDVGYAYTPDDENSFPLRGKGVAGIKTLDYVLNHFPNNKFLVDNKNGNNLEAAQLIVDILFSMPEARQKKIYLWTQDKAFRYIQEKLPSAKRLLLPRGGQKQFYKSYIFSLGLFGVPEDYKGEGLAMIQKYTRYIWGWPYRFLDKVKGADARLYMYGNRQIEFDEFYKLPIDGFITDYIEAIDVSQ